MGPNGDSKRSTRSLTAIASPPIHFIPQHSASLSFAEEDGKSHKNISEPLSRSHGTPRSDDSLNSVWTRAKAIDFCRAVRLKQARTDCHMEDSPRKCRLVTHRIRESNLRQSKQSNALSDL